MKKLLPLLGLILLGAGCTNVTVNNPPPPADPYAGWQTIMPGGVVSMKIPANCTTDAGAGSMYITCPESGVDQPLPSMVVSSDGQIVDIHHYEDLAWDKWDEVISTLKVIEPLDRDVTIKIEHN